ncbi:M48 family metallopeptidase [Streptomyces sp. NPDC007074]|uniref:M48 family metallopeptidase n=1 Tax=Streptomyces sp. NPDC007074 TaxID=3156764 RepID=UPI0033DC1BD4
MSFRLRAARAFTLLVGFYLMGIVLLPAIAAVDWLLITHLFSARAAWFEGTLLTVSALLAIAILRGFFAFIQAGRLSPLPHALPVTPHDQPELWAQIQAAAEVTGQRPPDELYLVAEANAGVAEQSRLLGLLPGRRRMLIGLPLLDRLTVPQLRAVLAHEFEPYANLDTRLGAITVRGREALLHTLKAFAQGSTSLPRTIGNLYVGYARMFLRASQSVARHQELAADQTAAQHAGRDATAAALRALPILDAAHTHYLETYPAMSSVLEALPPHGEVHAGFRRMLAARTSEQLALLASQQRPSRPHPYDSHPPTAERIALIEELATDGHPDGTTTEAAALTLLRDSDQVFSALEARTLPTKTARWRRMSSDDLVMARAAADGETWSQPLQVATARTLRSTAQEAKNTSPANPTAITDTPHTAPLRALLASPTTSLSDGAPQGVRP